MADRDDVRSFLEPRFVTGIVDENGQGFTLRSRIPLGEECMVPSDRAVWVCDAFNAGERRRAHVLNPDEAREMREAGLNLSLGELIGGHRQRICALQTLGAFQRKDFGGEGQRVPLLLIGDGVISFWFPEGGPEPYGVLAAHDRRTTARTEVGPLTAARVRIALGFAFNEITAADVPHPKLRHVEVKPAASGFLLCGTLLGQPPKGPGIAPLGRFASERCKQLEVTWHPSDGDPLEHLLAAAARTTLADGEDYVD